MLLQISFWELLSKQLANTTWLEWLGTISGFACVYLAAKQNIWNWPIAIISVLAYSFLFYDYKLYGDAFLQVYFLVTSIYGWYFWSRKNEVRMNTINNLNKSGMAITGMTTMLLTLLLGYFLDEFTDSNVPYVDGFCTALSFIGQFLMSRKVLQNWILWIIADICYVPLYLYKELTLTAILYFVFLIIAVMGYLEWRKSYLTSLKNTLQ
ncbi:MAG: nicotinamide mononucleotide transporter [Flavobacterium sp.]|nr:nicotinamide mononucleotide transporter [Pedobacter sp.]